MNITTAKIKSIAPNGTGLVVWVEFNNLVEPKSYNIEVGTTEEQIDALIQADVDAYNAPQAKADELKDLIGKKYE